MKHLSIQSVAMPKRKPQTLNNWVNFLKHTHKILVSSKSKSTNFQPKY